MSERGIRSRLHVACDIALFDHNGVTPKWVATPFSSDSIISNDSYVGSVIASLTQTDSDVSCKRALTYVIIVYKASEMF